MKTKAIYVVLVAALVAACQTVRTEDLQAWRGQPVSVLEKHPIFATMRLVKTKTSDGTELWNYVNGKSVASCHSDATAFGGFASTVSFNSFSSCASSFAACNNIFYVKNGVVQSYNPIGSGGARCYTDERVQPKFSGASNVF